MLDIHTHRPVPEGVSTPVCYGVHPWYCDVQPVVDDAFLPSIDMVGECGLDRRRGPSLEVQCAAFERQLQIAERLGKPVVVHCVHASDLLLLFRRKYHNTPWVFHGFTGGKQEAEQLWSADIHPSFGPAILVQGRSRLREAFRTLGPDRIFLETDDSGAAVADIYAEAALLLDISLPFLSDAVLRHFRRLFQ